MRSLAAADTYFKDAKTIYTTPPEEEVVQEPTVVRPYDKSDESKTNTVPKAKTPQQSKPGEVRQKIAPADVKTPRAVPRKPTPI